jgi:hypothetical protein
VKLYETELDRLTLIQREPLRYIERRIEEVELADDLHYAVTVTQQFTVPLLGKNKKWEARSDKLLLVPLGWFSKDRLPDIWVQDESGSTLPFLRRREQGEVGAILFMGQWERLFFAKVTKRGEREARAIWKMIQAGVEQVVTSSRKGARIVIFRLEYYLRKLSTNKLISADVRDFLESILAENKFWSSLTTLAEVRLLFTQMKGKPGGTYVVTAKYTERLPYRPLFSRDLRRRAREGNEVDSGSLIPIRRAMRRSLGWLGVGSTGIVRRAINLRQAASFWTIFIVPDGVEPIRCFWKSDINKKPIKEQVSTEHTVSVDATKAAAGKHHEHGQATKPDVLALDTQIASSSAITSAAGLAALLCLVGAYVYKGVSHVDIGALFAATPATLAGALAYRGHTFVRRISRGPRVMLALLSAQGALLAVVLSLHRPGAFTDVLAFILSIYSLSMTGVLLFIRFGPRGRKNERSRWRWMTQRISPKKCRQWQAYFAVSYLLLWLFGVVVVALTQATMQHEHIFSAQFPDNILHVWFG